MGSRPLEDGIYFITNDRHRNHALTALDNNVMVMEMASSRWRLQFHPTDGCYEITHQNSGLCLDLEGGGAAAGTNIITYPAHGGQNQRWKIEQLDQGSYTVQSLQRANLYMTAITDNNHYIINVIGDERTNSPRARWSFRRAQS